MKPAFLFLCIPARILLALASQVVPDDYLNLYGLLLLAIGVSFMVLFFTNSRLNAPEAGGKTWWAPFRPIIGAFYILAAIYAFQGKRDLVLVPLAMDLIFGIIIVILKYKMT
jgi:amino acid transporter